MQEPMERITDYLSDDHARLDALLARARAGAELDTEAYEAFRAGLLRHIGIEEKVLFPAAKAAQGGVPLSRAAVLHAAHARIGVILARAPTPTAVAELAALLEIHNADEEGADGVYAECEDLLGETLSGSLAIRAREYPAVRVAPYRDWLLQRPDDHEVIP